MSVDATKTEVPCPFKLTVAGALFYCKGDLGHKGRCWDEPPGVEARITWTPSQTDVREEILKCVTESQRCTCADVKLHQGEKAKCIWCEIRERAKV